MKELDSHSFEYVERVQDERKICEMLESLIGYLESTDSVNDPGLMCRAYFKKIEHIYYKFDVRVLKKKRVRNELLEFTTNCIALEEIRRVFLMSSP